MATKNLVPRESGSGNLGTTSKPWEGIFSDSLSAGSLSATTITANSISAITFAGINDNVKIDSSLVISGDKEAPFEKFSLKVLSMGLAASGAEPFIVLSGGGVGIGCGESITSGTFKLTVSGSMSAEGISAVSLSATTITADSLMYSRSVSANTITGESISATTLTSNSLSAVSLTADSITAGSITAISLTADSITAISLTALTITAASISALSISAAGGGLSANQYGLTSISGTIHSITSDSTITNTIIQPIQAFADGMNLGSPSIAGYDKWKTANTGATDVNEFTDGYDGQIITIIIMDALTDFKDSNGAGIELKLAGATDWDTSAAGDTIQFLKVGAPGAGNWYEISRSVNNP